MTCGTGWMRHGIGRWTILALLISGCATTGASETETTICRELRRALPTWSQDDTERSKAEGARFLDVFEAACGME